MNLLLVEPDKLLGEVAKNALEAAGCVVSWKRTAQTALDALDHKLPDVIVVELQLGLHNGVELLYEIRSYTEWQHIPFIVHTMNARVLDDRLSSALEQLGVVAVLYKPRTTVAQLIRAVKQIKVLK